jgi:hypothetical protein
VALNTMPSVDVNIADPLAPHSLTASELKELLAAERAAKSFLAFRNRDASLVLLPLASEGRMQTLGRRPEMDVSISWDREISGLHAEVQGFGDEWTIVDDGLSANGTFVNGRRIVGRQRLQDGDRIRVGRTTLVFKASGAAPSDSTVAAGGLAELQRVTDVQRRVLLALCRPYFEGGRFATPPSNQQIAGELFLSVDAVKMHLRTLFGKFELTDLPQNQKRARLAECAVEYGVITERDLR